MLEICVVGCLTLAAEHLFYSRALVFTGFERHNRNTPHTDTLHMSFLPSSRPALSGCFPTGAVHHCAVHWVIGPLGVLHTAAAAGGGQRIPGCAAVVFAFLHADRNAHYQGLQIPYWEHIEHAALSHVLRKPGACSAEREHDACARL